jgi:hypothetical protein
MHAVLEGKEEESMGLNLASRDALDSAWQSQTMTRQKKSTDLSHKLAYELFWVGTRQSQLR